MVYFLPLVQIIIRNTVQVLSQDSAVYILMLRVLVPFMVVPALFSQQLTMLIFGSVFRDINQPTLCQTFT